MYQKSFLENGIRIVTEKVPTSRIISVGIWIEVGSRDESIHDNGCSHFLEHMLFKGTNTRSAQKIAKELDALGGMSNAFTSTETTCFYASVLDKQLPKIVSLFSDIFLHSRFSLEEIERERHVILQEISMVEDTPDDQIHDFFSSLLWGEHPLGNTVLGPKEVVSSIDAATLKHFFSQHYIPENILIVATGNVDHASFCELWQNEFSSFKNMPQTRGIRSTPKELSPQRKIYSKPLEQVHMVLGTYGLPVNVEERYKLHIMNVLLGGNMSSRLFQEIREQRGLSYTVYSGLSSFRDCGQIAIYLGLDKSSVNEALGVINKEISRLKNDTISSDELDGVKDYVRAGLYLAAENMDSRMTQLAKNEMYFDRYISLEEMLAGIDKVSTGDVQEVARRIFSRDLAVVLLGPLTEDDVDFADIQ